MELKWWPAKGPANRRMSGPITRARPGNGDLAWGLLASSCPNN